MTGKPETAETAAWCALVAAAQAYAAHMDQWDKFQFQTDNGPVYVTISRGAQHPHTFEAVP